MDRRSRTADETEMKTASEVLGPTRRAGLAWLSGVLVVVDDPPRPATATDWWLLEDMPQRALKALGYFARNADHLFR
jgi:hypothetical protein